MRIRNLISKFRNLRLHRKISILLIISIIILTQIVGILSIAAISSLQLIIANIRIPYGAIYLNIDIYNPENMECTVPYYIQNHGIFDISGIFIETEMFINYIDELTSKNTTSKIFYKAEELPRCKVSSSLIGNFSGTFSSFNVSAIVEFNEHYNFEEPFKFLTNIRLKGKYFFNLIGFSIALNYIDLTGD
jgi:hypothetical protein